MAGRGRPKTRGGAAGGTKARNEAGAGRPASGKQKKELLKQKRAAERERDQRELSSNDFWSEQGWTNKDWDTIQKKGELKDVHISQNTGRSGGRPVPTAEDAAAASLEHNPRNLSRKKLYYDPNKLKTVFAKESKEEVEARKLASAKPFVRKSDFSDEGFYYREIVSMPMRPAWSSGVTKDQLEASEDTYFRQYIQTIYDKYPASRLNYFEHNLEVWRQLWRTCEKSDILLCVADARHPLFNFPPTLYVYAVHHLKKPLILLLNKIDYIPGATLQRWLEYFAHTFPKLHVVPFTSFPQEGTVTADNVDPTKRRERIIRRGKIPSGITRLEEMCRHIFKEHPEVEQFVKINEFNLRSVHTREVLEKVKEEKREKRKEKLKVKREERRAPHERGHSPARKATPAPSQAKAAAPKSAVDLLQPASRRHRNKRDSDDEDDEEFRHSAHPGKGGKHGLKHQPAAAAEKKEGKKIADSKTKNGTKPKKAHRKRGSDEEEEQDAEEEDADNEEEEDGEAADGSDEEEEEEEKPKKRKPANRSSKPKAVSSDDDEEDVEDEDAEADHEEDGEEEEEAEAEEEEENVDPRGESKSKRSTKTGKKRGKKSSNSESKQADSDDLHEDEEESTESDEDIPDNERIGNDDSHIFDSKAASAPRRFITIGMLGHPNSGKSSTINALTGRKVVSVSRTPGHTKYFQTIFLNKHVRLCDCPGLVFPAVDMPKPLQVLCGLYPIAQLRDPYSAVQFLAERVPLEVIYELVPPGQLLDRSQQNPTTPSPKPEPAPAPASHPNPQAAPVDSSFRWSALAICDAFAEKKGYRTKNGALDTYRAGAASDLAPSWYGLRHALVW